MTRILVLSAPDEADLPGLEQLPEAASVTYARDEASLSAGLAEAEVLLVTDFRDDLLARCWPAEPSVRWVHTASAGVDVLMFPALWDSDIPISNARGVFDRGIAEYVLGAVLLFAKDTLGNIRYQREHRWRHRDTHLIDRQKVLVVGAGSIGSTVAQLLKAVGMRVEGIARRAREIPGFDAVYAQEQLHERLPHADYVVITAPLTSATEGLFDARAFQAMQPGAVLINVGRGAIVRTDDLQAALASGRLAGAALDVLEQEPLPPGHPLWDAPKVMISAHMAGDFIGWRRALGEQFVANFRRWQAGEALFNLVNK
jgi:phosphoglycerate dehydrogenase-like enzyme